MGGALLKGFQLTDSPLWCSGHCDSLLSGFGSFGERVGNSKTCAPSLLKSQTRSKNYALGEGQGNVKRTFLFYMTPKRLGLGMSNSILVSACSGFKRH